MPRFLMLLLVLMLAGCGEDGPRKYLAFTNGGVSFDPGYTQATLQVVAKLVSPLPEGGTVAAVFEGAGLAKPQRIELPVTAGQLLYRLQATTATQGAEISRVRVVLLVLDAAGQEVERTEIDLNSAIDPHDMPRNTRAVPDLQTGPGQNQFDHGTSGHG